MRKTSIAFRGGFTVSGSEKEIRALLEQRRVARSAAELADVVDRELRRPARQRADEEAPRAAIVREILEREAARRCPVPPVAVPPAVEKYILDWLDRREHVLRAEHETKCRRAEAVLLALNPARGQR